MQLLNSHLKLTHEHHKRENIRGVGYCSRARFKEGYCALGFGVEYQY